MVTVQRRIFNIWVTCCNHPDNEFDWIPGCIWACCWNEGDLSRDGTQMISQVVPLASGEPLRYFQDYEHLEVDGVDVPVPVHKRVRQNEGGGDPYRERINEVCAGCGRALVMRDDTWDELSRKLETIPELWRPLEGWGDDSAVEATISLQMLARLAEEMRRRVR